MVSTKKLHVVIDPRQADRRPVLLGATIRLPGGDVADATVTDLSPIGFSARVAAALTVGMKVRIDLPVGSAPSALIAWIDGDRIGCTFIVPLANDEVRLIAEIWDGAPSCPVDPLN
jgi:hypothetical protein